MAVHRGHAHDTPGGSITAGEQRRVLWWSLAANGLVMFVEIVGGLVLGSLALLADAAHMASDVVALGIALIAHHLAQRPASERHTYGLLRAEALGAQVNGLILLGLAGVIVFEAVGRATDPPDVAGGGLLAIAILGLIVNLGSAIAIRRRSGGSLNMRGAYLHMALDAVGSVGAIVAGILILVIGLDIADALVSIGIALLVAYSSTLLLKETWHVLMEGTPPGIAPASIEEAFRSDAAVRDVHHLHAWSIDSTTSALSAHVVLEGEMSLHDAQEHGNRLRSMLAERFGIEHATLELECHPCDPV